MKSETLLNGNKREMEEDEEEDEEDEEKEEEKTEEKKSWIKETTFEHGIMAKMKLHCSKILVVFLWITGCHFRATG